jgi:DNA (cytosine-5)-methyltransferase 1
MKKEDYVLDLFSGPGGLSEGFNTAKIGNHTFRSVVANDNDVHASVTYRKNHPGVEFVLGDISASEIKKKIVKAIKAETGRNTVDVIIGGPPCKGFSLTNKMTRNMKNPMNQLVMDYVAMIRKLKPKAFVMENVPGIFAMEGGKIVKDLISEFKSMGYYNADSWLLNAADYGVPQIRKRAFIVGSRSSIPIKKPSTTHGSNDPAPRVSVYDAISDLPKIPHGSSSSQAAYKKPPNKFQRKLRNGQRKPTQHVTTKNSDLVLKRIREVPSGGNWKDIPRELMQVDGDYEKIHKAHSMIYRRLIKTEPSVTITNFRKGMIIHPTEHRLFSVREAARIQTFPDSYKFEGGLSSMQQQVSDAVPVFLAKKVAEAVLAHLEMDYKL